MAQLNQTFNFGVAIKTTPTEGNLVYEYNPFYNYRLDHTMIFYKNKLMEIDEFCKEISITQEQLESTTSWEDIIPSNETPPIVYQKGQLVDFETDELGFSLNNPVNITPQWSYDNSVNLIINDGLNAPRLINSRFSAIERNKYQVCNRKGNNDSNIYDQGDQFDIDTSLYKKVVTIPRLRFLGTLHGGNLSIGNYHFYFRYVDEDGNESDFFSESSLVSIFIGNSADSIRTGFRNENSYKQVRFQLSNTDPGYSKVAIYYTRATSDIMENSVTYAYRIDQTYTLGESGNTVIVISGYEPNTEITIDEINLKYQIYGSAETQASCQNMLFLANVDKPKIPYEDLADCALRFIPTINASEKYNVNQIGLDYTGSVSNTYYDVNYIYNKVGYWDDEIYRFGIVFIQSDNTLTDVFNIRGGVITQNTTIDDFTYVRMADDDGNRIYVNYDEQYYNIIDDSSGNSINSTISQENARGVIKINCPESDTIIGINITVKQEVIEYLQNVLNIKGYFFVRQKRIPTTLCQAYIVGIDKESSTPVLPIGENQYITESFLTQDDRLLDHDFESRKYTLEPQQVTAQGAICPEYDINFSYLNTLFSSSELVVRNCSQAHYLANNGVHFYPESFNFNKSDGYTSVKIIGVEDNVKLVAIGDNMFSARAGEAEEAFRFEYIGKKNQHTDATNLLRGSYGPYLGITGYNNSGHLVDIKIPQYNPGLIGNYFQIRYSDKSGYYAVSDRFDLSNTSWWLDTSTTNYTLKFPLYRGDCYICQFTHRINRNFQDPSAPTNDDIVDPGCWKDHFEVSDNVIKTENFENINLGDVNAVRLGMYITLVVRSTTNLNIRTLDYSNVDEQALFGHPRGFYPIHPMTTAGSYKIPEALCYNKGYEKSMSERVNFEVPDVPWIKNEFSNRIAYSNIQITDAFQNGWRTFIGTHYRDYPKTYGSITKIVELRGNLLCVFEHGVALIPVNERAVAGEGAGGNVYINTSNVLPENPKVLSDTFGSQWRDSVIKTPRAVYGVDTIGKKIWRTNGESFECISDFKVQQFLNQNISLTERELQPVIGVRNIKSHFNRFKNDVMFTFYDNLHGFEEKVWNLCWNEDLQKWITFYSWVPSYSENIYNQYFSFDRNTSKWITKLGVSRSDNDFSDGVVLSNNIIPNDLKSGDQVGSLSLANRILPEGEGVNTTIYYTLERDNYKNYKNFQIKYEVYTIENGTKEYTGETLTLDQVKNGVDKLYDSNLYLTTDASNLCSELYVRGNNQEISTLETVTAKEGKWEKLSEKLYRVYENDSHSKYTDYDTNAHRCVEKKTTLEITLNFYSWLNNCVINSNYPIYKDDRGRRINLSTIDKDRRLNGDKVVTLLNIRANITVSYLGNEDVSLGEAYAYGYTDRSFSDAGYYQSVVAVIPQYNMQFLTTDFWKHGQAGIIDIADKIYPTYWYGKQHPFEFEFIVADNPDKHKIFDNLEIISNNAEPDSFHYEIVGDCYDFAKDKKNMYIRQEATKQLYQYNGSDITYDHDYSNLESVHRPLKDSEGNVIAGYYDRSTLLPLYYSRQDTINDIEDHYHLKDGVNTKDFSALSGGEIVHYKTLDEYRVWNHAKAVDMQKRGRLRGNMQYNEDKWLVQINPINIVYKNEKDWTDVDQDLITEYQSNGKKRSRELSNKIPIELGQSPIPDQVLEKGDITYDWDNPTKSDIPENSLDRAIVSWGNLETKNEEVKLKDKWIKIRIRYTGVDLAVITAIKTLYSISYS